MLDFAIGILFRECIISDDFLLFHTASDRTSATTGGHKYGGKGHNGGVWEWTSTVCDSEPDAQNNLGAFCPDSG